MFFSSSNDNYISIIAYWTINDVTRIVPTFNILFFLNFIFYQNWSQFFSFFKLFLFSKIVFFDCHMIVREINRFLPEKKSYLYKNDFSGGINLSHVHAINNLLYETTGDNLGYIRFNLFFNSREAKM